MGGITLVEEVVEQLQLVEMEVVDLLNLVR
jgi:hypothetical protein